MENEIKKFFYRFIKEIDKYKIMKGMRYNDFEVFNHSFTWRHTNEGYGYWLLIQIIYAYAVLNKFKISDFKENDIKDYLNRIEFVYGRFNKYSVGYGWGKYKERIINASENLLEEIKKISV